MNMQILTSTNRERKHKVISTFALSCAALEGEFWDVGCFGGETASLMKLNAPGKTIRLFDSFEGLPEPTAEDAQGQVKGQFSTPATELHEKLGIVHAGWVPLTFRGLEESKIAFASIDLDLYEGTKQSLEFIAPRMVYSGVIVVDDYASGWHGIAKAVNEFLIENSKWVGIVYTPEQLVLQMVAQEQQ